MNDNDLKSVNDNKENDTISYNGMRTVLYNNNAIGNELPTSGNEPGRIFFKKVNNTEGGE